MKKNSIKNTSRAVNPEQDSVKRINNEKTDKEYMQTRIRNYYKANNM